MLCTSLEPPVVKSVGKIKNPADEIILAKSALVFHDSKNFDSSNGMLDLDACPGYFYMSSCKTVSPPRSSRSLLKAATSEREHPGIVNGGSKRLCQRMYPLAALLLAHVKTCRMVAMEWGVFQIDEYEK